MTTVQLIIVCVTALGLAGIAAFARGPLGSRGGVTLGVPVTVRTRRPDDQTLHGILIKQSRGYLTLADAEYVTSEGPVSLQASVTRVPREHVAFLTEHPPAGDGR